MKPGVATLPIDTEGNVYLAQEFRYGVARVTLEAPNGGLDDGEDPLHAAQRELHEETGITATTWINLGPFDPMTTVVSAPMQLFLAEHLSFGASRQDSSESISLVKLPFSEAVAMALDGRITNGCTIACILKAWLTKQK